MPIYTFKNKKTNEVYDKIMTYDELQLYVKDKDIEQIFKIDPPFSEYSAKYRVIIIGT